jgi:hypothetical protein
MPERRPSMLLTPRDDMIGSLGLAAEGHSTPSPPNGVQMYTEDEADHDGLVTREVKLWRFWASSPSA